MHILSLITHFAHVPEWSAGTVRIDQIDADWRVRSLLSKAWRLTTIAASYDCIVFFYDTRLAILFCFLYRVRHLSAPKLSLVFTTWLCDISRFSTTPFWSSRWLYEKGRWLYYAVFTRLLQVIVVHTSAEVSLYAQAFHVPRERFKFVPYCTRADSLAPFSCSQVMPEYSYVLAAGRNRDFRTFIDALRGTTLKGIIIASASDQPNLIQDLPANIESHFEVPFDRYRAYIAHASVLVIPLFANRWIRSLGQIATFEAVAKHVPVVAAHTFQLADYFTEEKEILFYEPGNPIDLRRQINRIMIDSDLRASLVKNAQEHLLMEYTDTNYTRSLLRLCRDAQR